MNNKKHNDISAIDKNFEVKTDINEPAITFYDVRKPPFRLYGLFEPHTQKVFRRLPEKVASETSMGVAKLSLNTAGGRVRFKTDSEVIVLKAFMPFLQRFTHMPLTGTAGFDLYINSAGQSRYFSTFVPPEDARTGYESLIRFEKRKMRDITVNFPLYSPVDAVYIGLKDGARLEKGEEYRDIPPVLYYGSSITQGGCASRPGNSYEAIISRRTDCDYLNFGFSGSALAEENIIKYLAGLDFSIFVMDYDYNAPNTEHLSATHYKAYKTIREIKPDSPIILVSKPNFSDRDKDSSERRNIIYNTYINAVHSGDKNIYYIDGRSLFAGDMRDSCTVDTVHPNDLGFFRMAEVIGETVSDILSEMQ